MKKHAIGTLISNAQLIDEDMFAPMIKSLEYPRSVKDQIMKMYDMRRIELTRLAVDKNAIQTLKCISEWAILNAKMDVLEILMDRIHSLSKKNGYTDLESEIHKLILYAVSVNLKSPAGLYVYEDLQVLKFLYDHFPFASVWSYNHFEVFYLKP